MVSVVVPTMNSAQVLEGCLEAVGKQTWKNIETIVVDGHSKDDTVEIAEKNGATALSYGPLQDVPFQRLFGAPWQWNYGVGVAKGEYVYLLASDIRLSPSVIEECVRLSVEGPYDAIVIPEMSYGEGYWAQCKSLQRSFFVGDSSIESPMFFRMSVWKRLDGFDPRVEGYVDWDLTNRLFENQHKVGRINSWAYHYEGRLQLTRLLRKKYVYGKATFRYFSKHSNKAMIAENFARFSPLRPSYLRNIGTIFKNPKIGAGFAIMTTSEYVAAAFGAFRGMIEQSAHKFEAS